MEKLSMEQVNYGDHYMEKSLCDKVQRLNGGIIDMSENHLKICAEDESLETEIEFYEKDPFTNSWVGKFSNGTQFRIVKPNPRFIALTGNTITIASMYHDGYAVHFNIV